MSTTTAAKKTSKDDNDATTTTTTTTAPKIFNDPRFRAGSKLIKQGRDGAIDIFATLLEEARTKYGEASIETAPAYFEYGNALFRESQRHEQQELVENNNDNGNEEEEEKDDEKKEAVHEKENEEKQEQSKNNSKDDGEEEDNGEVEEKQNDLKDDGEEVEEENGEVEEEEEEEDDIHLALNMMETAYAIFDNYVQSANQVNDANAEYLSWTKSIQIPRVLSCIGDVLSALDRHADAADAYTRELAYRDATIEAYNNNEQQKGGGGDDDGETPMSSLQELQDRRKAVEANVLVAQELLACPDGEDVVTTETNSLLVKASERLSFATGYYQNARDQLQETVYLMGKLASRVPKEEFKIEKENICFASALLMAVGESIAEHEANEQEKEAAESLEPSKKKAKR